MPDEPFTMLAYAKPAPAIQRFVLRLVPLSCLLVGLVGWVIWSIWSFSPTCTRSSMTAAYIQSGINGSLDMFKFNVGRYPHRLDELLNPCPHCSDSAQWRGPYLKYATRLKDVWGRVLIYQSPGLHNKASYDLSSSGPDGVTSTPDDITNW